MKYDVWLLGAILIKIIEIWPMTTRPFPLQFLIKSIETWPMNASGNFHYITSSKSLKYSLWLLGSISFTIPYQNHWNMTYECQWQFPLQFLIKIIEMWRMTARGNPYQNHRNMTYDYQGHFLYNFLSKASNMTYEC